MLQILLILHEVKVHLPLLISFTLLVSLLSITLTILNFLCYPVSTPVGGGTRYIKKVGMFVENFEIDP